MEIYSKALWANRATEEEGVSDLYFLTLRKLVEVTMEAECVWRMETIVYITQTSAEEGNDYKGIKPTSYPMHNVCSIFEGLVLCGY